jgi:hypothetical protein
MSRADGQRVRDTVAMILQFPSSKEHGAMHTLNVLDTLFQESGLGKVDGYDWGGGKINLFVYDIRDADWQAAFDMVVGELTRLRTLELAVVARSISWETQDDEWIDYDVFWPSGYDKEFSIW